MTPLPFRVSDSDFTGVYDRNVARVYGFLAYAVRSRADAEDLTQQTFERAMRAWARYDAARASVSTWLLVIARNLLIDHLRDAGRTRVDGLDAVGLEAIPAPADQPSLGLDTELEQALGQLAPRERELIALRYGGDLTSGEIAEMTGLSAANVQQILSRSLRRMRTSLRQPVGAPS